MSLPFDPVELAMLHSTGYFGVPEDKLKEIAEELRCGKTLFDAAWDCGIDPDNLTEDDLNTIRDLLEED